MNFFYRVFKSIKMWQKDVETSYEKYSELTREQLVEQLSKVTAEFECFAYIVSHDLQAPLRSIVSFSKLLKDRHQNSFDEKSNRFFNFIIDSASHLQGMVEGLLLYSRLGTKGEEFTQVSLNSVLEQVIRNSIEEITQSKTILHIQHLPDRVCDPAQIKTVLQVLIDNAIKFQTAGHVPEIWIDSEFGDDKSCVVRVRDNGIGIAPNKFNEIFNIFRQLNKPSEYTGLGLGLALAKKIIERHKGKIWVESELGKGSTFFFTLK